MFQTTQPHGGHPQRRVGDPPRIAARHGKRSNSDAGTTHLASLNPSLLQDLQRFAADHRPGDGLDLLEVLAASLRHNSVLQVHLQNQPQDRPHGRPHGRPQARTQEHTQDEPSVLQMTVLPAHRRVRCHLPTPPWQALTLLTLRVLRVASLASESSEAAASNSEAAGTPYDLGPLLWHLALHGARGELLPEIAGVASYRVTPGASLDVAEPVGALAEAVQRLQGQTTPLREIASWPGFDRDRAARLLNALYLQSALIVTRSHPGALSGL